MKLDSSIIKIAKSIAEVLCNEKAHQMPVICDRYNIGDGSQYVSPSNKETFLFNLLQSKDLSFLLELAQRIEEDYNADTIAFSLNEYQNGTYFKISIITRKELLVDLLNIPDLNGIMTIDDFLLACKLPSLRSLNFENYFASIFSSSGSAQNQNNVNLGKILNDLQLFKIRDNKFFLFLEQIVHPYNRSNEQAKSIIELINSYIHKDNYTFTVVNSISGQDIYKVVPKIGVGTPVKNLIFASTGFKPEIVLIDALSNKIEIRKNAEYTLVYDRPIKSGLLWLDLMDWWNNNQNQKPSKEQASLLRNRLFSSLDSPPEKVLFETYYQEIPKILWNDMPALIPQVYLHYDPFSVKKFGFKYLLRQRMDFLLLLKNNVRIVIEVDGKQHYSDGNTSSPKLYSEMVSEDRKLKLAGYEVYRFGGYELTKENSGMIKDFFVSLFEKHDIIKRQIKVTPQNNL